MAGSWNIDVAATAATIKATAAQVESVQPALVGMGRSLEQAAAAIPGEAAVVLAALNDVLNLGIGPAANEVVGRSGTIITSTVQAVNFYQQGDLAMASSAQRSAGVAAVLAGDESAGFKNAGPATVQR
jgi:hypothetical protein